MQTSSRAVEHSTAETIELGALLHDYHLSLVLVAGATTDAASRRVHWVHASELEDPTPFLTPRAVILTTAARFDDRSTQDEADAYVERLIAAGTTALGLAVGLHWDRVPLIFTRACDRLGLPLFRVPYATSFISIVQTAARLLEQRNHARDTWLLESQRHVTNASLHRNGLGAAVQETATRLGRWVAITDRTGHITEFAPDAARARVSSDRIRQETRRMVERGIRSARIEEPSPSDSREGHGTPLTDGTGMQLRALGRHGQTLGVLVVADAGPPDHAERTLIGLVEALATVQLEHRTGVGEAEALLRAAIVELLTAGEPALAERVAARILTRIPRAPLVVFRYDDPVSTGFTDDVQSLDAARTGLLRAESASGSVIIAEASHVSMVRRLFRQHAVAAGLSQQGPMSSLTQLMEQASLALSHAHNEPVAFHPDRHASVFDLLRDQPKARWRADALLSPVRDHDGRHTDRIEESLRAWLKHHGQTSPAAAALGIHRHTLRARVQTAARLLRRDLDSPDARAEIWAALSLAPLTEGSPPIGR